MLHLSSLRSGAAQSHRRCKGTRVMVNKCACTQNTMIKDLSNRGVRGGSSGQ